MQSNKLKLKPVVVLLASLFATGAFAQDEAVVQTESVSVLGQGQRVKCRPSTAKT